MFDAKDNENKHTDIHASVQSVFYIKNKITIFLPIVET